MTTNPTTRVDITRDTTNHIQAGGCGRPWIAYCVDCAHWDTFTSRRDARHWASQHAAEHTSELVGGAR